MSDTRYAVVTNGTRNIVQNYLPSNYVVVGEDGNGGVVIAGEDVAGWTLQAYVIPRLASGLLWATELLAN